MPKVFLTARQRREDAFRSAIKAYTYEENATKKELAEKANIPTRTALGGPGQYDAGRTLEHIGQRSCTRGAAAENIKLMGGDTC
ncbi:hypothetical protein AALH30_25280 [Blautia pseudococcoides]|uniref:hypothetical protein n=1 Tax=Blautia pseudococcoides TaxID=1796616 RepID=UPI003516D815